VKFTMAEFEAAVERGKRHRLYSQYPDDWWYDFAYLWLYIAVEMEAQL
jgi:hypothetical protein